MSYLLKKITVSLATIFFLLTAVTYAVELSGKSSGYQYAKIQNNTKYKIQVSMDARYGATVYYYHYGQSKTVDPGGTVSFDSTSSSALFGYPGSEILFAITENMTVSVYKFKEYGERKGVKDFELDGIRVKLGITVLENGNPGWLFVIEPFESFDDYEI